MAYSSWRMVWMLSMPSMPARRKYSQASLPGVTTACSSCWRAWRLAVWYWVSNLKSKFSSISACHTSTSPTGPMTIPGKSLFICPNFARAPL